MKYRDQIPLSLATQRDHTPSDGRTRKIHVSKLAIGMQICQLDRDWLDTPFLMQGFTVETQEDVDTVAQYCEYVWIEALKEHYVPPAEQGELAAGTRKQRFIKKVSTQDQNRQALGVYREARRITRSLMDEARLGRALNSEQAKGVVSDCIASILRNPDALMWMSRLRSESEYMAEHSLKSCILAVSFGRHLGMSDEDLHKIGLCGLLHDVGMMKVPPRILHKQGVLTPAEYKLVKAHALNGRNLLMGAPGFYHGVVDVAYSHHERLDGTGYPRGLKATGISQFTRIISIVDAYDAMTTHHGGKAAKTSVEALKELQDNSGTQFDADLVERFGEMIGLYPPGNLVELNNGCVAIVLDTNREQAHLPRVLVARNAVKKRIKEQVLNLADIDRGRLDPSFKIERRLQDGSHGIRLDYYKKQRSLRI
ncbi:HD-GYP domain-containing protein [Pseudomaricurvus alkylphenolicus]|jgi:HD-GYP domain-containing protein (c-di-GMP phosphodiesterase class II)|uniref:HD-GYP domain-containing protein n=1 Tax=Pseudomaricurvus alkylphenolicus TaxID=1306991 RepID=UPI0014225F27|nr:HD-GYP domain-containing protein [Pseudomaricurvus alkylphenolicus]NIB42942.1 HD-GYP domain-containing protein [Pseudomaricurvus alkylphenolicus]